MNIDPKRAPYPRDQWYIAAWGHEVGRQPFGRTILGEPVVMWRAEDGTAVAHYGLCPHRLMPLARGTIEANELECPYHGIRFGLDGRASSVPTQDRVPAACNIHRFPLVEKWRWLWIWPGDPALADPALIPDTRQIGLDADGWRADANGTILLKARWQLLVDNLFDLSHIGFVHASILGKGGVVLVEPKVSEVSGRIEVVREMSLDAPEGFHQFLFPELKRPVITHLTTELLGVGLVNAGGPYIWLRNVDGGAGDEVGRMNFVHGITPETPHTTHYFSVVSRNFRQDDDALSQMMMAQDHSVRLQDVEALEAIEPWADSHGDPRREVSLFVDGGALRVRRTIARLIAAEAERGGCTLQTAVGE